MENIQSKHAILFDWIVDFSNQMTLRHETIYLTMYIYITYIRAKNYRLAEKLAHVIFASLCIAVKFEETHSLSVSHIAIFVNANLPCTRADLLRVEVDVLCTLNWKVAAPTLFHAIETEAQKYQFGDTRMLHFVGLCALSSPELCNLPTATLAHNIVELCTKNTHVAQFRQLWNDPYVYYVKQRFPQFASTFLKQI